MTSRILGLNLSIDHTLDVKVRDDFNRAMLPAQTVVMVDAVKDIPKIIDYQKAHPYTAVIGRVHYELDGGMHDAPKAAQDAGKRWVVSPLDWINAVGVLGQGDNGWCYVMNEPDGVHASEELKSRLVEWIEEWQRLAIIRGVKSVLFNFGDRHPLIVNGQWEARYHGILRTCAQHPDLFRIGLHSYGPDGLVEHLAALVATCEELEIKPVQVVLTEYGLDTHLGSPDGYKARGWTGQQYARWKDATINGELRPYIDSGVIVGLCVFCWNANPRWGHFDVQLDKEWRETILAIAGENRLDVVNPTTKPTAQFVPKPQDAKWHHEWQAKEQRNIRSGPAIEYHEGGTLLKGDKFTMYDSPTVQELAPDGQVYNWKWVESDRGNGWCRVTGWGIIRITPPTVEVPVAPPHPVEIPTPKPPEIVLTFTPEELTALIDGRVKLALTQLLSAGLVKLSTVAT